MSIGGTEYQVALYTANGARLAILDRFVSLEYARVLNNIGAFSIVLPSDFDITLIDWNRRIDIWRKPPDSIGRRDFSGFIMSWDFDVDELGEQTISIIGSDHNDLLRRRIIAYAAGLTTAEKTDNTDDMIKAIIRENLGASAPIIRNIATDYGFTVDADTAQGPTVSRGFSRRNMLDMIRDIADISRNNETELFFEIVRDSDTTMRFSTFINQRQDRTADSAAPLIFSRSRGNLSRAKYRVDYRDHANVIYCGGQGEEINREIAVATDEIGSTVAIARVEKFVDARQENEWLGVVAASQSALIENRPRKEFTATIQDALGSIYGTDWDLGYRVTASEFGLQFDCLIRAVTVKKNKDSSEQVTALLENYA